MFSRFATTALLAAALSAAPALAAPALAAPAAHCALHGYQLGAVKAHRTEEHFGKLTRSFVDGGSVFVYAAPGVSAEWLQRSLHKDLARMKGSNCPLGVDQVHVSVTPAGDGYWVTLRARDAAHGKQILERLETMAANAT